MEQYGLTLRESARRCRVAYSSLKRWIYRRRRGDPVVRTPGPRPLGPFDWVALRSQLRQLRHGRKRTRGTGEVLRVHRGTIPRRRLQATVNRARERHNRRKRARLTRIEWLLPNLVWAVDDTWCPQAQGWVHSIRDLASRFQFEALTGSIPHGDEIAAHLEELFRQYGPPLVLKRDNGSNLNHHAVDEVLARWLVIPLNSPVAYPQYNGAIESSQRDWSRRLSEPPAEYLRAHLDNCCARAAHDLNHQPRGVLEGRTPCAVFHGSDRLNLSRRQRKEAHDWITQRMLALVAKIGENPRRAWRTAVQTLLHDHQLITIRSQPNCYPVF
jgi:hypothetical protein